MIRWSGLCQYAIEYKWYMWNGREGRWPIVFVRQMNSFQNEPYEHGKEVEYIQQQHVRDVSLDCHEV